VDFTDAFGGLEREGGEKVDAYWAELGDTGARERAQARGGEG